MLGVLTRAWTAPPRNTNADGDHFSSGARSFLPKVVLTEHHLQVVDCGHFTTLVVRVHSSACTRLSGCPRVKSLTNSSVRKRFVTRPPGSLHEYIIKSRRKLSFVFKGALHD